MHTLHLIEIEDGNDLLRVRAVREALRALDPEPETVTVQQADQAIQRMRENGASLLGYCSNLDTLVDLAAALEENGCTALIDHDAKLSRRERDDRSPEEVFKQEAPEADVPAEPEPDRDGDAALDTTTERPFFSAEAYETSMALIAHAEGVPGKAAAMAFNLARTTGDTDLYTETIQAIVFTFPWIREALVANGVIE